MLRKSKESKQIMIKRPSSKCVSHMRSKGEMEKKKKGEMVLKTWYFFSDEKVKSLPQTEKLFPPLFYKVGITE